MEKINLNFLKRNMEYNNVNNNDENSYDNLFEQFFIKLVDLSKSYDYVVLTTRRCFCLISCIYYNFIKNGNIVNNNDEDTIVPVDNVKEFWEKVLTSQGVNIVDFTKKSQNDFNNCRILLVDDVMIHGKAVLKIFRQIKEKAPSASVHTFVMVRNNEVPDYYQIESEDNYAFMCLLNNNEWLGVSRSIVDYFTKKGFPYVSYLYYLRLKKDSVDNELIDKRLTENDFELVENNDYIKSGEIYKNFTKKSHFKMAYYRNKKLEKSNNILFTLRKYEYTDSFVLIPYFEINYISKESILSYWNEISNDNNSLKLKTVLNPLDIYKAITAILGLEVINSLHQLFEDFSPVISEEINKSFYRDFYQDVLEFLDDFSLKNNTFYEQFYLNVIKDQLPPDEEMIIEKNSDSPFYICLNNVKTSGFSSNLTAEQKFLNYISDVSELEEKNFKESLKKYKSQFKGSAACKYVEKYIPQYFIFQQLQLEEYSILTLKNLLMDWGALSNLPIDLGDYIALGIKTGELSYCIPCYQNRIAFFVAVKFYDKFLTYFNGVKLEDKHINEIINYFNSYKNKFPNFNIDDIRMVLNAISNKTLNDVFKKYKLFISDSDYESLVPFYSLINNYFNEIYKG